MYQPPIPPEYFDKHALAKRLHLASWDCLWRYLDRPEFPQPSTVADRGKRLWLIAEVEAWLASPAGAKAARRINKIAAKRQTVTHDGDQLGRVSLTESLSQPAPAGGRHE